MKRVSAFRDAVLLIALLAAAGASAEEPGATPVVKKPSGKLEVRGEAKTPAPGRIEKKPAPILQTRVAAEACTSEQEELIEAARKAAAIRSQVATDRARGVHPTTGDMDRREAERKATLLIDPDVNFEQVVELSEKIRDRVSSSSLRVVCEAESNPNCAVRSAYVQDLQAPIHICPAFFETSTPEQRIRTLIHESAHLAHIREEGDSESYCVLFDCQTSCGGFYVADAWAHFVHCVAGEAPDAYDSPSESE